MGTYSNQEWYIKAVQQLTTEYGDVPPPWVYSPNGHPYSMEWRMGGGESHIMILGEWLDQQNFDQEARIAYMRKYPPPPRWLQWAARFIWALQTTKDIDFTPYFEQLKSLGFEGVDNFEEDSNDERWE
ncbi:hypothetical protein [Microscilla marina]|uniref:Uncharacterized protein n=1 Tax=Microscilla marina ATCC 23134 TaxID=313606 RepID=A1ZYB3_MICM2|nr:hypothetical protein [Microscilla marina]EAY24586.1 hypothetical protein M23134_07697 [Microscilla marina ATCC 23134]